MRFSEAHIVILCESTIEIGGLTGLTIEISVNFESWMNSWVQLKSGSVFGGDEKSIQQQYQL